MLAKGITSKTLKEVESKLHWKIRERNNIISLIRFVLKNLGLRMREPANIESKKEKELSMMGRNGRMPLRVPGSKWED